MMGRDPPVRRKKRKEKKKVNISRLHVREKKKKKILFSSFCSSIFWGFDSGTTGARNRIARCSEGLVVLVGIEPVF